MATAEAQGRMEAESVRAVEAAAQSVVSALSLDVPAGPEPSKFSWRQTVNRNLWLAHVLADAEAKLAQSDEPASDAEAKPKRRSRSTKKA